MDPPQHQANAEGERIQAVMFLRHGIATHNLRDPLTGQTPNLHDPNLWDPSLVDDGMKQALDAKSRLMHVLNRVELVVASPLTRCLQTAHLVFFPGCSSYEKPAPTMMCLEHVREAYGMHYPDKRRDTSLLQDHWPMFDFSDPTMSSPGEDPLWSPTHRECMNDVVRRVDELWNWVVQRPESTIFVVSHGVFIESLLHAYSNVLQDGTRIYNCDCYWGEVVSQQGQFVRFQNVQKL